ncbi:hypothetical protein GGS26DRAFT_82935 [Hypomontagnella submonticulosa]|nr:hypothetical protein GGS26DRAFT_82935 [Hypomontagnella submonticulosa]
MPQLRSFPRFSELPAELRLMVWEQLALPKGPLLYSLGGLGSHQHVSSISSLPRLFPELDPFVHDTAHFRNLARVNREARATVLRNRKLFRLRSIHGVWDIFIDWERDAIHWTDSLGHTELGDPLFRPCINQRIQNLAIRIACLRRATIDFRRNFFLFTSEFRSLRNLQLIIGSGVIQPMYIADHPETSMPAYIPSSLFPRPLYYARDIIPLLSEDLHLLLEQDPDRYSVADDWQRNVLQPLVNDLTRDVSSAMFERLGRNINVHVSIEAKDSEEYLNPPPGAHVPRFAAGMSEGY